jgi:hypothetical protein
VLAAGFSTNVDVLVGLAVDAYFDALEDAARLQAAPVLTGQYAVKGGEVNLSFSSTSEGGSPGLGLVMDQQRDGISGGISDLYFFGGRELWRRSWGCFGTVLS